MKDNFHTRVSSPSIHSLGIDVTPESVDGLLALLQRTGKYALHIGINLHSSYRSHTDPEIAEVFWHATVVFIAGQPIRWLAIRDARSAARFPESARLGSVSWLLRAGDSWNLAWRTEVGADAVSNTRAAEMVSRAMHNEARGWHGQHWSKDRASTVAREVGDVAPDLVLTGLGVPLQEHFYERHLRCECSVAVALVGAAIDQLSVAPRRAPRFVGREITSELVTVVVPTTERAHLWQALSSVVQQSTAITVVVIEAGALRHDAVEAQLEGFKFNATLIAPERRLNASAARNLGTDTVRTPFVACLDDDDRWRPGKVEAQFSAISAAESDAAVCPAGRVPDYKLMCSRIRYGHYFMQTSSLVINTELAREARWDKQRSKHRGWGLLIGLVDGHGARYVHIPQAMERFGGMSLTALAQLVAGLRTSVRKGH